LIDTTTDSHLWSERYDRPLKAAVPGQQTEETSSVPTASWERTAIVDLHGVGRTVAGAASWSDPKS